MTIRSLLFAAVLLCTNCFAASTTNFDDQWGVPGETGWGLSIQQQADTMFINIFVYDQTNQPTWFIGAVIPVPGPAGHVTFAGDLFKVTAPYYGSPWNQALAQIGKVGTMVFDADSVTSATFSYSVNGVNVSKRVERELWSYENYSGSYLGGIVYDVTNCGVGNGHVEDAGSVSVTQVGNTSINVVTLGIGGGSCTFNGTYSQLGHMGTATGNVACTNGIAGPFTMFEMEKSISGMTGRVTAQSGACLATGRLGGLLR